MKQEPKFPIYISTHNGKYCAMLISKFISISCSVISEYMNPYVEKHDYSISELNTNEFTAYLADAKIITEKEFNKNYYSAVKQFKKDIFNINKVEA